MFGFFCEVVEEFLFMWLNDVSWMVFVELCLGDILLKCNISVNGDDLIIYIIGGKLFLLVLL